MPTAAAAPPAEGAQVATNGPSQEHVVGSVRTAGTATLTMPDGSTIPLPVLLDAHGGQFVDVRKLHPR